MGASGEPDVVRAALLHLLATAGGGLVALITVLPLQRAVDYTGRATELAEQRQARDEPRRRPRVRRTRAGRGTRRLQPYPEDAPLFFGVWFAVVLLWFVPWKALVLQRPGMVTSVVGLGLMLVLSQAPSNLGALRWPVRMLPGVPLFLGVGVGVAVATLGLRLTRARVVGVFVTDLRWVCSPGFGAQTQTLAAADVLLFGAAALLVWTIGRRHAAYAGHIALATTVLMVGWTAHEHADTGMSDRGAPPISGPGRLALDERPTLVLYPNAGPPEEWFPQGVAPGFLRLTEMQRTQPGYSSIGQRSWDEQFCVQAAHSYTCGNAAEQIYDVEPRTGRQWVDLLGYQDVVLHDDRHLVRFRAAMRQADEPSTWRRVLRTKDFVLVSRVSPLAVPGRVTSVIGEASVTPEVVENATQSYRVHSADGATLVFRDLYWPGYVATLDGEPVEVSALDDMLLTVTLPPGADGNLEVIYDPMPRRLWLSAVTAGALVVLVAVLLLKRSRRSISVARRPGGRPAHGMSTSRRFRDHKESGR